VIGGFVDSYVRIASVEILRDGESTWQQGPNLPYPLAVAASVTDPLGSVLIIGGEVSNSLRSTKIYRLRNAKSTQWELFPYSLKTGRGWLLAFTVPEWVTNCQ